MIRIIGCVPAKKGSLVVGGGFSFQIQERVLHWTHRSDTKRRMHRSFVLATLHYNFLLPIKLARDSQYQNLHKLIDK
jgi:hypothetical protein